ncbi:MAG: hypothetical protein AAFN78_07945 [Pseudomonadota bacterium]
MMHGPEERGAELKRQFELFKRYRVGIALAFLAVLVTGSAIVMLLPAQYRASATILIEQQQVPQDLVRTTVTGYAKQRIQVLAQRVMTSANLMDIIKRHDLYAKERRFEPREKILERMRDDIELEYISADVIDPRSNRLTSATIAFTLSIRNERPAVAFRVANELTSLFLSGNLKNRTEMAEETSRFLSEEAKRLELTIAELEEELATYRSENFDRLPEFSQTNLQLLDRTDREYALVESEINSLSEKVVMLETRLSQAMAQANVRNYGDGARGVLLTPAQQAASLRAELAQALTRYTDDHPDVRRLQRELAALAEVSSTAVDDDGEEGLPDASESDAAVMNLAAALDVARIELAGRQERFATLQQIKDDYRERLNSSPQVEGRHRMLTRDYEAGVAKYREIKAKLLEANLAQALEVERKSERFTLIEPPVRPEEPEWPNRPALVLLSLVLALASALVYATVRGNLDRTVYGMRELRDYLPGNLILTVPPIVTAGDRQRARTRAIAWSGGTMAAMLASAVFVHLTVSPLGTLWLSLLRRMGL